MDISSQSFLSSPLIYPSLAQCFVNSLAIAAQTLELTPFKQPFPIHIEATPSLGSYRSAIALSLPPKDKAKLATTLGAIAQSHLDDTLYPTHNTEASVITSDNTGWVEIQYSLELQLTVINHLTARSIITPQPLTPLPSNALSHDLIFELQYAHARCSSQLNLAKAIAPSKTQYLPQAIAPWLSDYFSLHSSKDSIEQQLWLHLLNFPSELQIHKKLLAHLNSPPPKSNRHPTFLTSTLIEYPISLKQLNALSQTWVKLFQKFYSQSRLFEITQPENQNLLALRLSLFEGLRAILNFILTELIQISAPQIL